MRQTTGLSTRPPLHSSWVCASTHGTRAADNFFSVACTCAQMSAQPQHMLACLVCLCSVLHAMRPFSVLRRSESELDPVTLHNMALVHMDKSPSTGFKKLNFLLSSGTFPPETFANLLLLYCAPQHGFLDLAADVMAENPDYCATLLSKVSLPRALADTLRCSCSILHYFVLCSRACMHVIWSACCS